MTVAPTAVRTDRPTVARTVVPVTTAVPMVAPVVMAARTAVLMAVRTVVPVTTAVPMVAPVTTAEPTAAPDPA